MNKILSLCLSLLASVTLQAQKPEMAVTAADYSSRPVEATTLKNIAKAPRKVILGENQYVLGNSTSDEYDEYGMAPYGGEVLVGSVIYSKSYAKLKNCRALGIRFCIHDSVKVKCVTLHDSEIDPIKEQVPTETIHPGWNYVQFDEPQLLDPKGTFISYTFIQEDGKSGICNWPNAASGGFYVYLYNSDQGKWSWANFSSYYGAVCIQLIVEADPLPDYDLEVLEGECLPTVIGEEGEAIIYLNSNSQKDITNIDYELEYSGQTEARHSDFRFPVAAGLNKTFGVSLSTAKFDTYGDYPVTFRINKVNGDSLAEPVNYEFTQRVFTRRATRRTVVEEFTGTGCGWCPRGWVGMEYLKETFPDMFIGVAVHQYNTQDPMYCNRYCNPGFGGAPTCVIDRKETLDPYFGSGAGIDTDFLYYNKVATEVDVTASGTFSNDLKKVSATADVEFLANCGRYKLAFVLTADKLKGRTGWKQENYYSDRSVEEAGVINYMPDLSKFCSGGEYAKNAYLTFNDVLIGSSYNSSGTNLVTSFPTQNEAGSIVTKSYNVSLTAGAQVLQVLDYSEVYLVAIVTDADGRIANAYRTRVALPEGIGTVLSTPADSNESHYDLNGRLQQHDTQGLNIVRGTDGRTRKVLVR